LHAFQYVTHCGGRELAITDLEVEFYNPAIPKSSSYVYRNVPVAVCEAWYAAPSQGLSLGEYFIQFVKTSYECQKVK
jgi:hypothetical protein